MIKILLFTLALILIALIDGGKVFKSKDIKKISVYSSIFFTAAILCLLILMDVKIPNPLEPVKDIIVSIFGKD